MLIFTMNVDYFARFPVREGDPSERLMEPVPKIRPYGGLKGLAVRLGLNEDILKDHFKDSNEGFDEIGTAAEIWQR